MELEGCGGPNANGKWFHPNLQPCDEVLSHSIPPLPCPSLSWLSHRSETSRPSYPKALGGRGCGFLALNKFPYKFFRGYVRPPETTSYGSAERRDLAWGKGGASLGQLAELRKGTPLNIKKSK